MKNHKFGARLKSGKGTVRGDHPHGSDAGRPKSDGSLDSLMVHFRMAFDFWGAYVETHRTC